MSSGEIAEVLWSFGLLTAGIWGLTEILGNWFQNKNLTALFLGGVFYPALTALGVLDFPLDLPLWKKVVSAFIFGLIAVGASALLNDKVINPFRDAVKGR